MDDVTHISDLEHYCYRLRRYGPEFSLEGLRERLDRISSKQSLACSHYFHEVCIHPNATIEMIRLCLEYNPFAADCASTHYAKDYTPADVDEYEAQQRERRSQPSKRQLRSDRMFPIHLACLNHMCPHQDRIVQELARRNPSALGHLASPWQDKLSFSTCLHDTECLPIHFYHSGLDKVDLETVMLMAELCPLSLRPAGKNDIQPLHIYLRCAFKPEYRVVEYLLEKNPASIRDRCRSAYCWLGFPLQIACENLYISHGIIKCLVEESEYHEGLFQKDQSGFFPIHRICAEYHMNRQPDRNWKEERIKILKYLVEVEPYQLCMRAKNGSLPLHVAIACQCPEFCRVLIAATPDLSKAHMKANGSYKTVLQDALELNRLKHVRVILEYDEDGASRPLISSTYDNYLPLHFAARRLDRGSSCDRGDVAATVQMIFEMHPDALLCQARNRTDGSLVFPFHLTNDREERGPVSEFLRRRLRDFNRYCSGSREEFPLIVAISSNVSTGVIRLLVTRHLADQVLVRDDRLNSPIHAAAKKGRVDVMNFLLEHHSLPVSDENSDGRLPIELLAESNANPEEVCYQEAIWRMLLANPDFCRVDLQP